MVSTAAFHAKVRGSVPGLSGLKETKKIFLPHPHVKVSIAGSLRDREVAYSASDRQGSNFESCVWRTVSSQLSHHPQEVLLAQFSLYVHKGGLKPDSFHFFDSSMRRTMSVASQIDQRFLKDESAVCCGQLYRKLHSSLAAPSMMLGDYQRLLADRCEFSAMPSLCCDLFCRLIVLSHTGCVTAYDGIVLQQQFFL